MVWGEPVSHSQILELAALGDAASMRLASMLLNDVANVITVDEAWDVLTLVDTPDVFG